MLLSYRISNSSIVDQYVKTSIVVNQKLTQTLNAFLVVNVELMKFWMQSFFLE